ncbi:hypothetical protein GCM10020221_11610 [Streptomyces thioluteus]|uniref:HTH tetR-type domain-containing protein n=1 Tax=Streptomyces thioluteus TaxID=66431 RepID=A0ABP6J1H2_STRTU
MGTKRTLTRIGDDSGFSMRDLEARRRILSVTHQMLVTQGYMRMTIGGVATNAGVGKATIYRTWPNKPALVLEALRDRLPEVPTADLGDSRAEMLATASTLASLFGLSEVRSALPGLMPTPPAPPISSAVSRTSSSESAKISPRGASSGRSSGASFRRTQTFP